MPPFPQHGFVRLMTTGFLPFDALDQMGAQAIYGCIGDYVLIGAMTRVCMGSGRWSGDEPVCYGPVSDADWYGVCGPVPALSHAQHHAENVTVGSAAQYVCDEGYYHLGHVTTVSCQLNGEWSAPQTACKRVLCESLSAPLHGQLHGLDFRYGTEILHTCDDGYFLVGAASRTCQADGAWSGAAPQCQGTCKASVTTRRTCFCVLSTCKNVGKRRASVRGEYHLRTESYGFGSTQTRRRTLSACNTFSTCGLRIYHPCVRVRATRVPRTAYERATYGLLYKDDLTGDCQLVSKMPRKAQKKSTRQDPKKRAAEDTRAASDDEVNRRCTHLQRATVDCGQPPAIPHGHWLGDNFTYSHAVQFYCEEGFSLVDGTADSSCGSDGRWSGQQPRCKAVDCGDPGFPPHSTRRMDGSGGTGYNTTVSYSCEEGYQLFGSETRTCTLEGVWDEQHPECHKSCDGWPPVVANAERELPEKAVHLATVTYICEKNYRMEGPDKVRCLNGVWQTRLPVCVTTACTVNQNSPCANEFPYSHVHKVKVWPTVAISQVVWARQGQDLQLDCINTLPSYYDPRWKMSGRATIRHTQRRVGQTLWQRLYMTALRTDDTGLYLCETFDGSSNAIYVNVQGEYMIRTKRVFRRILLQCGPVLSDFTSGPRVHGREFESPLLSHMPAHARYLKGRSTQGPDIKPTLQAEEHATSSGSDHRNGDVVSFSCEEGYILTGPVSIECQHGAWSAQPPTCVKKTCEGSRLQDPADGYSTVQELRASDTLVQTFYCDVGYELHGTGQITCAEGNWYGGAPVCLPRLDKMTLRTDLSIVRRTVQVREGTENVSVECRMTQEAAVSNNSAGPFTIDGREARYQVCDVIGMVKGYHL
ncbi:Sushi, von Willebrand factor type A, EGF and pentraxin [Branchiostoma belcheri]|nr:Sushi, von Willebrand factor type A, EGF and pentraxin [Branchiostoma belcheri]